MAVIRRSQDDQAPQGQLQDDPAFQHYLRQGGSAATPQQDPPKDVRFTLHIPGSLCQALDQVREARPLKISRHQWVLEAILEKIQRASA